MPNPYEANPEDEYPEEQSSQPTSESSNGGEKQNQNNALDDLQNVRDLKDKLSGSGESGGAAAGGGAESAVGGSSATGGAVEAGAGAAGTGGAVEAGAGAAGTASAAAGMEATAATGGLALPAVAVVAAEEALRNKKTRKIIIGGVIGAIGTTLLPVVIILVVVVLAATGGGALNGEAAGIISTGSKILTIQKNAAPAKIDKGVSGAIISIVYTFTISNKGTSSATGVKINDVFSGRYVDQVDGKDTCSNIDMGTVAPGSISSKSCTVTLKKIDDDWFLSNIATVNGSIEGKQETSSASFVVTIGNPPDLPPSGCPVVGQISTPYGINIIGYTYADGTSIGPHTGVDIIGVNPEVHSTLTGTATQSDGSSGLNIGQDRDRIVTVTNGFYSVIFHHLENSTRIPNGPVLRGQVIGIQDNTGKSTGDHVHYEIRDQNSDTLNPMFYMPVSLKDFPPATPPGILPDYSGYEPYGPNNWGQCNGLPQ